MARTRSWWNSRQATNQGNSPLEIDLLAGSGLAVAGATIQRCIGRVDASWPISSASGVPFATAALEVTSMPDATQLDFNSSTDFLWWEQVMLGPRPQAVGDQVTTFGASPGLAFDVAGMRTLAAGESLWLLYWAPFQDPAGSFDNQLNWSIRVLVLGPDV